MPERATVTCCRICDGGDLAPVLDLGRQPWCNNFLRADECGREPLYPLRLVYCHSCGAAQLDYTVPKEVMFGDHTYLSGVTRTLAAHFRSVAEDVDARFFQDRPGKAALDIGSNDGTQLLQFRALAYDVLGVESARTPAARAVDAGIPTVNAFFNAEVAHGLGRQFDVVNAAGVFFHLEELHSFTEGVREALAADGVFVVQCLYMKCIVEHTAFDQIYHEHLTYYTLQSLERLLSRHGLEAFDAYVSPIHGGSAIVFASHAGARAPSSRLLALRAAEVQSGANRYGTYTAFAARVAALREQGVAYLAAQRRAGRRIFGFGAPAKGNTLLNYFGLGRDTIECLVEKNALRRGLYAPGTHIPIVLEDEVVEDPDLYYVLAWNFREEILANHRDAVARGVEFHFPIVPAVASLS